MPNIKSEEAKRIGIAALLRVQVPIPQIAEQENVARSTVYAIKRRLEADGNLSRKATSISPRKLTPEVLEDVKSSFEATPTTSIRKMAKIKNIPATTLRRGLNKLGLQSKVRPRRQLLTGVQKTKRVEKGGKLVNWIKRGGNGKLVKVFTDEKNFYVDQAYNRRNDRCVVPRDAEAIPVMRTKHPPSVMMFGLVTSDGKKMPPYYFDEGLRVGTKEYYKLLRYHIHPWLKANYPEGNFVFQQDGAPSHNSQKCQDFCRVNFKHFWDKSFWPPNSPDLNPLDYSV